MRRRWMLVGVLAAVGLLGGACEGETTRDEAGVARPSTTEAPGREEPTTSAPATPISTAPPSTTPPTTVAGRGAVYVNGIPQVTVTPSRAPVGTTVEVEGYGFTGEPWQTAGGPLWLSGTDGCGLFAPAEHDLRVSGDGQLTGTFVVPEKGECRFEEAPGEVSIAGGHFNLAFQCTACLIGTFTVILDGESMEEPTGTECAPVNFGGGENIAAEVFADGLPCAEAESFIRDNAGPWGPVQGPFHVTADGFSCDRTGYSDRFLPRANYKCTRGAETIWFNRT